MIFYHATTAAAAAFILRDGFHDFEDSYGLVGLTLRGVFVADQPVDSNEGAKGDELLEITLPDSIELSDYELIEENKPYREWCLPADLINKHGSVRLVSPEEQEELIPKRFRVE